MPPRTMSPNYVIILAAGDATRLKSKRSKVMHPICGRPMVDYVLEAAFSLRPKRVALVLGHDRETVLAHLKGKKGLIFAHQRERLGTGHAAHVGLKALGVGNGRVLILSGDVPLLTGTTLKKLQHLGGTTPLALLTAVLPNPRGYGRIMRNLEGEIEGIVEEKNATPEQRQVNEINAGVYLVDAGFLKNALPKIKRDPIKKEFYLTEIVAQAVAKKNRVQNLSVADPFEILGVNTRAELAYVNQRMRSDLVADHLERGVGMQDPDTVYVDHGVKIGPDSFLGAGVQLLGKTQIGPDVSIETGCILKNCVVKERAELRAFSYLEDCEIRVEARIGPFARIRPGSVVERTARVGNFVEVKKTYLGKGSKANHLSYLGDATIGKNANIGAGTITCNYDGKRKNRTILGDEVFVGSGTQLVAPVKVGKGAYIGAGTTVTRDVPAGSLAVSRTPQKNLRRSSKKK